VKARFNRGLEANIYFYRDSSKEVDMVYTKASKLQAIEIKSGSTIHEDHFSSLKYFNKLFPEQSEENTIIYAGEEQKRSYCNIINPWSISSL
jgi:predicted AAA+ superfamily ATPase